MADRPNIEARRGDQAAALRDELAVLRTRIFADWPYLYAGDAEYEARYLSRFFDGEGAFVVAAFDGRRLVGAATASPLSQHHDDFAEPVRKAGLDVEAIFYLAESVLLPAYRGMGIGHCFFDLREEEARRQGFEAMLFCAVEREADDPRRPENTRSLEPFWRQRGYRPLDGVRACFCWREHGDENERPHAMRLWLRQMNGS